MEVSMAREERVTQDALECLFHSFDSLEPAPDLRITGDAHVRGGVTANI